MPCEHKWEWQEDEPDTGAGGYYECVHCGETKADDEPDSEPEMSEFV